MIVARYCPRATSTPSPRALAPASSDCAARSAVPTSIAKASASTAAFQLLSLMREVSSKHDAIS